MVVVVVVDVVDWTIGQYPYTREEESTGHSRPRCRAEAAQTADS